ncbi:EKC/KEOPS complex subunit Tprkb-like [Oscarella lobularis]|uniref:EKC/KEOPS complex subunit Tprkb-like n=1 Tax=Oscarella lobularis TaxID=121494 RepID=UPI0033143FB0
MEEERTRLFQLDLEPSVYVGLALFTDVKNAADLRKKVADGNLTGALLEPKMIVETFQVLVAANKTVQALNRKCMKTRGIHTEIIYNLSPTRSITDSLKKFAIGDESTSVLLAVVDEASGTMLRDACRHVDGHLAHLDDLVDLADSARIRSVYKIGDNELRIGSLLDAVVMRMATKDNR